MNDIIQNRYIAFLILFLMTLPQIGTDIYLSSLPVIKTQLLTTDSLVQLTFSIFLAGFALSQLFYGPISDKLGRKPILLIGTSIYLAMSILGATTASITLLLVVRVLQGIGAGSV